MADRGTTSSMGFKRGERLTAAKMNALAQMASQAGRGSTSQDRPGSGIGWRGGTTWADQSIQCLQPPDKGRNKPFDIVPQWDLSNHVLSAYHLGRCQFHNGDQWIELLDQTIDHEHVGQTSCIYLAELSAADQYGHDIPLPAQDRWTVIDDIMETMDYPKEVEGGYADVKSKWRLYLVNNGVVSVDVRDAFVQVGGNAELTGEGGQTILDLSSLDWLTAQDAEPSAQAWHYSNPEAGDFADASFDPEATGDAVKNWRFYARPEAGGTTQYVSLSSIVGELSSIVVELSSLSVEISSLSSECSALSSTTITGNVPGSVAIGGDIFIDAMLSSNVSCLTEVDQNNVSRMWLGCYYLGWMLPLFTMLSM